MYWDAKGRIYERSFIRSFHSTSRFRESNCSSDFGYAETGSGVIKRVVLL